MPRARCFLLTLPQKIAAMGFLTKAFVSFGVLSTAWAFQSSREPPSFSHRLASLRPQSGETLGLRKRCSGVFLSNTDDEGLGLQRGTIGDKDFWTQQKELAAEMLEKDGKIAKEDQKDKFAKRRLAFIGDTAYFGFFIFCILWSVSDNPFVAVSYTFGATMGLAYAYGLGKYVETIGGSIDEVESVQGAGVGQARFAFLILLFLIVGKFRDQGLLELPSIAGFFTYQLASLSQGLREIND